MEPVEPKVEVTKQRAGGGIRAGVHSGAGVCAGVLLASCALGPVEDRIAEQREAAEQLIADREEPPRRPLVIVHDAPYLASDRIAHASLPWLHQEVDIKAAELPFELCLAKALEQLDDPPSVVLSAAVVNRAALVTLDHRGTFRDFLELLASASGFAWQERAKALHWMAEVTRTFEIHRVPGDLALSMETAQADDQQVVQSGGSGSSEGVRATPESSGSINLRVGVGFWESLEDTLVRLLGVENAPIIDKTTGTVVAHGPADRVRQAEQHIDRLNAWLGRQVLLEIQLVTVNLSDDRSMGIDWKLVGAASGANPVGSSTLADLSARSFGNPASVGIALADDFDGTQVILRALQQQGETTVRNAPRFVALNGQAAQLQVLNDRAYLARVDVITRETAALATEVQQQAGSVSTGISVTILPKIVGDRVFLHANVLVSDLVALDSTGTDERSIQLPSVDRTRFFQSARLRSGETLALGGLSADRGDKEEQSIARFAWLGAKKRRFSRSETVLLITPTLLDRAAPDEDLL